MSKEHVTALLLLRRDDDRVIIRELHRGSEEDCVYAMQSMSAVAVSVPIGINAEVCVWTATDFDEMMETPDE